MQAARQAGRAAGARSRARGRLLGRLVGRQAHSMRDASLRRGGLLLVRLILLHKGRLHHLNAEPLVLAVHRYDLPGQIGAAAVSEPRDAYRLTEDASVWVWLGRSTGSFIRILNTYLRGLPTLICNQNMLPVIGRVDRSRQTMLMIAM